MQQLNTLGGLVANSAVNSWRYIDSQSERQGIKSNSNSALYWNPYKMKGGTKIDPKLFFFLIFHNLFFDSS